MTAMSIMKIVEREVRGRDGMDLLVITAELRVNQPLLSDGFAITADLYEARRNASGLTRARQGREQDAGGCLHREVLAAAPELAPLVQVHLASPEGVPMHAVANGWYFYSGKARAWEDAHGGYENPERLSDVERAARALHIPVGDLPEGLDRDGFEAFAESLRPRWGEQAAEARQLLESLPGAFRLDGQPDGVYPALGFGLPWNGWATPVVKRSTLRHIAELESLQVKFTREGAVVVELRDEEGEEVLLPATEYGYDLAPLGWRWVQA